MSHSFGVSGLREELLRQLVVLGEDKRFFLDALFRMHDAKRMQASAFLDTYVQFIKEKLTLKDEQLRQYVWIGCTVECDEADSKTSDAFTIAFPHETDPDLNRISFLSPVGNQLLMASVGETRSIATPSGPMRVRITGVSWKADSFPQQAGM